MKALVVAAESCSGRWCSASRGSPSSQEATLASRSPSCKSSLDPLVTEGAPRGGLSRDARSRCRFCAERAARGHSAGRSPCGFRRQCGHAARLRRRAGASPAAPMVQPPGPGRMMPSGGPARARAPDARASNGRQGAADAAEQTASTGPPRKAPRRPLRARLPPLRLHLLPQPACGRAWGLVSLPAGSCRRARRGLAIRPAAESRIRRPSADRCLCAALALRGQGRPGRPRAHRHPGHRPRSSRQPACQRAQRFAPVDQRGLRRLWQELAGRGDGRSRRWPRGAAADSARAEQLSDRESGSTYAADHAPARREHEAAGMADVALHGLCRGHQPHGRQIRGDADCADPGPRGGEELAACSMSTTAACRARPQARSRARSASTIRSPPSRSTSASPADIAKQLAKLEVRPPRNGRRDRRSQGEAGHPQATHRMGRASCRARASCWCRSAPWCARKAKADFP